MRPFWVVQPDFCKRDTCLCIDHENFALVLEKLYTLKMLAYKYPIDFLKSITCDAELRELCLERKCGVCCFNKKIVCKEFENEQATFPQWSKKRVEVLVKGKMKTCFKTVKEELTLTKKQLFLHFINNMLEKFMRHVCNIKHQYKASSEIKNNLGPRDIFIHCDFSENCNCKYSKEIQSLHFGGSRNQVSIHTVVEYYYSISENKIKAKSYCTFSDNRQHDFVEICAHLKPVINDLKEKLPTIETVHFLSDSTSQQYRNKSMFYLLGTFFRKEFGAKTMRWHFTEMGHGKGAPDGIGGCIKRTTDRIIGQGKDIPDINCLVEEIKEKCPSITIYTI